MKDITKLSGQLGGALDWAIYAGIGLLAFLYLRKHWAAIWEKAAPVIFTKQGPVIFAVWLLLFSGAAGLWVGGRMMLLGAPVAVAQTKGK